MAPSTSPPQSKHFFILKRTKNYASTYWVYATAEVVLTVHQPCISVCIGNPATTTTSLIGKHMCTRLYYDRLLCSLHPQSGSSPSKSHPLTTMGNHILPQWGLFVLKPHPSSSNRHLHRFRHAGPFGSLTFYVISLSSGFPRSQPRNSFNILILMDLSTLSSYLIGAHCCVGVWYLLEFNCHLLKYLQDCVMPAHDWLLWSDLDSSYNSWLDTKFIT